MRFDIFTAVLLKFLIFWGVTLCCWVRVVVSLKLGSLTLIDKNGLMIFENRVLRGIFDLIGRKWQEDG